MDEQRSKLLDEIWTAQDTAYDLMEEYDALPHYYGQNVLYQAEGTIINLIGSHPDITITDLGEMLNRTSSACSQIVRKLRGKGWVEQIRNPENNRQYNLRLTESGKEVYEAHLQFNRECQAETYRLLAHFTKEELAAHLAVQKKINEAYREDIQRSNECLYGRKRELS